MIDETRSSEDITFAQEEYNSLRAETIERISIMNNQASSAFGIILTTWASGFALLGIFLSNKSELSAAYFIVLLVGQISSFLASLLMLIPMAIKSGENLRQLTSLSIYIRVFYDFASNIRHDTRYAWDTADKRVSAVTTAKGTRKFWAKRFNSEYTVLGITSSFFLLIILIVNIVYLEYDINLHCVVWPGIVVMIVSIYFVVVIHKRSNIKDNMMELSKEYTKKYLVLAVETGIIQENELTSAWTALNPQKGIDIRNYSQYFEENEPT